MMKMMNNVNIDNFGDIDMKEYTSNYEKLCSLYNFIKGEICINSKNSNKKVSVFAEMSKNFAGIRKRKFDKYLYLNLWKKYSNSLRRKIILCCMLQSHVEKELVNIQIRFNEGGEFTLDEEISIIKLLNQIKTTINIVKIAGKKEVNCGTNSQYNSIANYKNNYYSIKGTETNIYTSIAKSIVKEKYSNFDDVKNKLDKTKVNLNREQSLIRVFTEKENTFIKKKKEENIEKTLKLKRAFTFNDFKMPENVKILFSQKIPDSGNFVDSYFPPETCSLMPLDEDGNVILPKDIEMQEISDWVDIKWKKPEEIFHSQNFQVFIDKIEANDILQGNIGNCYFLAAIASLCELDEKLITNKFLFHNRSTIGCYGIYLRIAGIWKLVLLDDYFPAVRCYRRYELAFARSNGSELWVILFEKAWAKLCGNYLNTIAGLSYEVFDCITNSFTEKIILSFLSKDKIWEKLIDGQNMMFVMSAGSGKKENEGIVSGHAYSILYVKELKEIGLKIMKLRNPYGEVEWTGDWSDDSDLWTKELREELKVNSEDDGIFWISFDDFIKYFEILNICKIHKDYKNYEIHIKKKEVFSPVLIEMNLSEDSHVYIQIHQRNKRFRLKDNSFPEQVIINLILLDENYNFVDSIYSKNNVECIERRMSKGKNYLITDINYRFIKDTKIHGYAVSTYSENSCQLIKYENCNADKIVRKAYLNYTLNTTTPVTSKKYGNGVKFYKRTSPKIPGILFVFENDSEKEFVTNLKFKDNFNCGIYDFETHLISLDQVFNQTLKSYSTQIAFIKYIDNDFDITYIENKIEGVFFPLNLKE